MKKLTALIATTAFLALPSAAFAQLSTDVLTDKVKDKAVDSVMDNLTTDDAITAGKTLLKGGSKTDAAKAVVAGRAEDKVESMTGTKVDLDDLSKDGLMDAGKDVAMEKAKGSANKYIDTSSGETASSSTTMSKDGLVDAAKGIAVDKAKGSANKYIDTSSGETASSSTTMSKDGLVDAAKGLAVDKAKGSSTQYIDKAKGSATTYSGDAPVIEKSVPAVTTDVAPAVNCPSGTKDAGDGTCMVTGDWNF